MEPLRLHYSEALLRRVVRAYWWRETGWSFSALLALLGTVFGMLLLGGDRSWRVGALGTFLVICALVSAAVYVTHYRASLGRLRRMRVPAATLALGDERVRVTSDFGVAEMEWRSFSGVHRFPRLLAPLPFPRGVHHPPRRRPPRRGPCAHPGQGEGRDPVRDDWFLK